MTAWAKATEGAPAVGGFLDLSEQAREAEARWRAVIDGQRADLDLLLARWPDRKSPEVVAALGRLRGRVAPGGEADEAVRAVHAAYGGTRRVPASVRRRMERYSEERLGGKPWPWREPSESTDEPALRRKERRRKRRGEP